MFDDPTLIRFIVMPIVGVVLGIRDGHLDARAGTRPFDYTMKEMLRGMFVPFCVMTAINLLAQANSDQGISFLEALGIGGLCSGILYTISRNSSNQYHSGQSLEKKTNQ